MINDKQVNLWRGSSVPPTIYHIWIRNNSQMLIYNGTEWVVFIDDEATIEKIDVLIARVDSIESKVLSMDNYTVNNKAIKNNPVLNSSDLLLDSNGHFVKNTDSLTSSTIKLDTLLTTQIIE